MCVVLIACVHIFVPIFLFLVGITVLSCPTPSRFVPSQPPFACTFPSLSIHFVGSVGIVTVVFGIFLRRTAKLF